MFLCQVLENGTRFLLDEGFVVAITVHGVKLFQQLQLRETFIPMLHQLFICIDLTVGFK